MRKNDISIILQARMGSSRLPGKVLKSLAGKPMIQWIVERLKLCEKVDKLILATSTLEQDQPLVNLAEQLGIRIFRGSENDVLDRYYQCAKHHKIDYIIRATGDNPFVDPIECDKLIHYYLSRQLDYATISTEPPGGFPLGVGVEIFNFSSLEKSWKEGHAPHHREHVNEYILENPTLFIQSKMTPPPEKNAPEISLTVDTSEEFSFAEKLYVSYQNKFSSGFVSVPWVIKYLKNNIKE